jgi:hypothetical protein
MSNRVKVLIVATVAVIVILAVLFVTQRPRSEAQTMLSMSCGMYLEESDCKAFAARIMAQSEAQVMSCYNQYSSFDAISLFYSCLEDAGVVPE